MAIGGIVINVIVTTAVSDVMSSYLRSEIPFSLPLDVIPIYTPTICDFLQITPPKCLFIFN